MPGQETSSGALPKLCYFQILKTLYRLHPLGQGLDDGSGISAKTCGDGELEVFLPRNDGGVGQAYHSPVIFCAIWS